MTDIAPKRNGIIAISAIFGLLAAVVALFAFAYSVLGAILIGLIVAVIVAIILWMSWQDASSGTASDATIAAATSSAAARTDATATAVSPAAAKPAAAKAAAKPAAKPAAAKPAAAKAAAKPAAAKAAAKPAAAKAAAKPAAAKAAAKPAATKAAAKPAVLAKARAGGADNLKMIKGVGPVLEKALHTTGVFHFDQVGAWTKADAEWFDDNVKGANGRVIRDGWVKQAKILAKGGTTEFSARVKKGGVY
ncbi:MAG: NADH:quinone oxidoreductase [Yoonia sp.]|nr:NADH:quinone oxidoreductase [Yoonia sp.]